MIGKQIRMGLCSSTVSLVEQTKKITSELNIDLDVSKASLDHVTRDARRMEAEGVEVILAGSVTGTFLIDQVNIPIVKFEHQSVDAMENVARAAKIGKRIFLPQFQKIPAVPTLLTELLELDVGQGVFSDEKKPSKNPERCERGRLRDCDWWWIYE